MALLFSSSQVPGLHRRLGKKMTARPGSKRTGPSPAQRIAAQLASRTPRTVPQPMHPEDDPAPYEQANDPHLDRYEHANDSHFDPDEQANDSYVDHYDDRGDDNFNTCARYENKNDDSDSNSETEPESNDEDEHMLWEEREQRRELRRQNDDRTVINQPDGNSLEQPHTNSGQAGRSEDRGNQWEVRAHGHQDGRRSQNHRVEEGGQHNKPGKAARPHDNRDWNKERRHGVGLQYEHHRTREHGERHQVCF